MNVKGSLSLLILNALAAGPSHGYAIAQAIRVGSAGVLDFREGTLYPTLHALEERGLICSGEQIETGRTRRCYHITAAGRAELERERASWLAFSRAVATLLGEQ